MSERGFFMIGIERHKTGQNLGSLWRSAAIFGSSLIFTVNRRYSPRSDAGLADTTKAYKHTPLMHFSDPSNLLESLPRATVIVGVELVDSAMWLNDFHHPERACYVLGSEDNGLSKDMLSKCHHVVKLPGRFSMNVACAGTAVMYDRWAKRRE